ncbi:hypothetical protein BDZ89DRAFT_1077274 [Hymenopellis radicata]|nr:hypothetical protein BDZ89DRAFT_1077274 [Hymenopellis radicata]
MTRSTRNPVLASHGTLSKFSDLDIYLHTGRLYSSGAQVSVYRIFPSSSWLPRSQANAETPCTSAICLWNLGSHHCSKCNTTIRSSKRQPNTGENTFSLSGRLKAAVSISFSPPFMDLSCLPNGLAHRYTCLLFLARSGTWNHFYTHVGKQ